MPKLGDSKVFLLQIDYRGIEFRIFVRIMSEVCPTIHFSAQATFFKPKCSSNAFLGIIQTQKDSHPSWEGAKGNSGL